MNKQEETGGKGRIQRKTDDYRGNQRETWGGRRMNKGEIGGNS